jgi:hypothetical protein
VGAPALHWAIAKSKLPPMLKLTCYTLALVADAEKAFANIWLSKETIGAWSGRGERQAREDLADLVAFDVLTVVSRSRGGPGRSTCYQLWFDRLASWSEQDTEKLLETRRKRRPDGRKDGDHKPGSADPGSRRTAERANPDRRIRKTRIRRSAQPGSADPGIRTTPDLERDVRSTSAEHRSVHAVENPAALAAQPPAGEPAPASSAVNPTCIMRPQRNVEENRNSNSAARFRILSEIGRKLLAGYGLGEIPWADVRSDLRNRANRFGIDSAELIQRVEDSLRAQHAHFLTHDRPSPAPPTEKTPVRPANEVEL